MKLSCINICRISDEYVLERVVPYDKDSIDFIYGYLLSNCPEYSNIDRKDVEKCCNSIYIIRYTLANGYSYITGVIGCRRLTMDEVNLEELKYYCQPNKILYSIEFFHVDQDTDDAKKSYLCYRRLLRECIADKNDAFIYTANKCPLVSTMTSVLKSLGFEFIETKNSEHRSVIDMIKKPTTCV